VLERDAQYATLVELGMEAIGGLVDNRLGMASATGDDVLAIPSAQTIRDVYREQAGSLLVVGDPGSGKTTALLTIARDLLDRADCEDVAIPVIFNLSSWVAKQPPLRTWLADELAAKYGIPMDVGRTWLGEDRLIPFLDGLDEVSAAARAQCVEAINAFQDETSLSAMVVACRYKEYTDLPGRLTLNAAVRLRQLTLDQVDAIVAGGGAALEALAQVLRQDSGFRVEARSPLMMRIMIEAYRGVRLEDLAHESAESMDARRNRIVGAYVERKLRVGGRTRS
jgi:eukaryotic-like serine/threonine-protein kinase